MADPYSQLDPGQLDALAKFKKDIKDCVSSPLYHSDPSQTKITNPIKRFKRESKTNYSEWFTDLSDKCFSASSVDNFQKDLRKLDFSGRGLRELPEDLGDQIEELNLSNNHLASLAPFTTGRMISLKKLNLSGCGLKSLDLSFLWRCNRIEDLNLSKNPLTHSGLCCIGHMHSLKKLDLSSCGLKEFPCVLKNCVNLQELNLSNNFFDHQDLLDELNSGKKFTLSGPELCPDLSGPTRISGSDLSRPTRIIFEDAIYTNSDEVWIMKAREECNVSDQEDAPKSVNEISKVILQRCKSFENTVESLAEKKLKINKASVEDPKGGKATKFVDVAGPAATIICTLAGGITIAMSVAPFGATSLATALAASAGFAVKIVDKHVMEAKAKVVQDVVNTAIETTNVSSYLSCVVKDVAKELSRIFEYQLLQLQNDEQVEVLAKCAVDLMLDLKKDDIFDRNTLLKKVLQDGHINKRKLVTKIKDIKWSAPNVFRKPGLRRLIFGKDAKFQYFVKPNNSCKAWKYGYRSQFLELKRYNSENDKGEISPTDETHNEDPNYDTFCEECSSNCEKYPSDHYFSESDIDAQYTDDRRETLTYHPLHILIQCPNVLDCFQQFQGKRPPLACFLKRKLGLPEDHIVHPVYRPHSPGKVCDLQNSDFTGSDFSHCDFTNSCLEKCNFTKCVMLFTNLAGAKFSGSKFRDTFISHSNLKKVVADRCEWTKTSLLHSSVDGAHVESVEPSIAGNCLKGTNICDAITIKMKEINCNEEEPPRERMSESKHSGAGIPADHCEKSALVPSNVNDRCVETMLPNTGGSCSNGANIDNANMRKTKHNEILDVLRLDSKKEESEGGDNGDDDDDGKSDNLLLKSQEEERKDDDLPLGSQEEKIKGDDLPLGAQEKESEGEFEDNNENKGSGQTSDNSIIVDQKGGCFKLSEVCAFLLFPPNAVDKKVTLKCCRVRHKECQVEPSAGQVFVSQILKIEPEGMTFKKPVTVLLSHSLYEDQDFLHFYELVVENLNPNGCQELKTDRISSTEDIPNEISNKEILDSYLPFAKTTIHETCTLVAAARVKSEHISIATNEICIFSKQYGNAAQLKITFPAGVTEDALRLKIQLFPADAVLIKGVRLNRKNLVCGPVIRVSGQTSPFLKEVAVELTYSHSDVVNIKEEFLPVSGKAIQFTTDYGWLIRSEEAAVSAGKLVNLNESSNVYIERPRTDQLKFSFLVDHFSECPLKRVWQKTQHVQPEVKTDAFASFKPQMNRSMMDMNNQAIKKAVVLAVHDTVNPPKTLHAVLAPGNMRGKVQDDWSVQGKKKVCTVMNRPLRSGQEIYFCVPLSEDYDHDHLPLDDYCLRFDPDEELELENKADTDLTGKYMHFLVDNPCSDGKNHSTQGDCRAKAPIHIDEPQQDNISPNTEYRPKITLNPENGVSSIQGIPKNGHVIQSQNEARTRSPEVVPDGKSPDGYYVSPEDARKDSNKVMKYRCELFEKAFEKTAQNKLEIIEAFVKNPKGGKVTEVVNVAGPTATIIFSLAGGITIAVSVATFGAASFAAALVAGATLLVTNVDKALKRTNAKELKSIVETDKDKAKMSCFLKCIVKDVAKELSRIFEYQIFELQSDEQVEILAECAVDLMLDLKVKKKDTFDRDTLLRKVLQDGSIRKKDLLTSNGNLRWSAPDVFRKPGLRRTVFGKNGVEFKYYVKPKSASDPSLYGYRGQFVELKVYDGKKRCETSTDETHKDPEIICKECSCNLGNYTSGRYFCESNIDTEYTELERDQPSVYHPLHILVQCPKVLVSFKQEKISLSSFLKNKSRLPEHHFVRPVYRSHSAGNVPDLPKANLTATDFSHANFTKTVLAECNFTGCVMLFADLEEAKMPGSKFCGTFISHSNLKKVAAVQCEWTQTYLLDSRVDGAHLELVKPSIGGNHLDGTNICDAITTKKTELNGNKVWTMKAREDAALVPAAGKMTYKVSSPKEETWLDEFCRIRKSEKLTIETYHSMLKSLKILVSLVGDNVESCSEQKFTLKQYFFEIQRFLLNIEASEDDPGWHTRHNLRNTIFILRKAVSWLMNCTIDLEEAMKQCALAIKKASRAFSECFSIKNGALIAKLQIISQIMSNLTKPELAIPWCLQSLQELHDLPAVREVFSSLDGKESDFFMFSAKSVFEMNKILFEFVQAFFKPPPSVEEWPVTIQLLDQSIYNPLIDKRLMDTEKLVSRETQSDIREVDYRVQNPVTDVAGYSYVITESCGQTAYNSITVDTKGGCFSLPEVCAFLLFPSNAVDEKVTLKCCRVRHGEYKVKLSDGEVFVSRILKIEPEGVTFKKPVTVLLSHSLDEDQEILRFYELTVKNSGPTGYQTLTTEAISCIEDVPKEICNKEVLDDYLPLAKATIQETCTLAATARARFNQILIPTNRRYVFCKQYGDIAELKITFPAGVTKEILSLKVQLFPADAVVNNDVRLNKSLVCAPIIRVSGQKTSFLEPVDVELTYSHSDVANIKDEFLPVGKTIQFTTEYGLLLRNQNETESKPNWQALNKSNDVSIERSRKDQLKFSFSVKHFSDIQPVVKTSSVSYVPQTNSGMVDMNNPRIHHGIVLAVHDIHSNPPTLLAVLAPKLYNKWKTKGCRFMSRLKYEEPIYFCVPMSDTIESEHLSLKDYTLRFDPEDESELANSVDDDVNLREKDMRFLKDRECNNGENHTTQGDCRAKVPIYIFESRSVQESSSSERHQFVLDSKLPKGHNVTLRQEDAQTDGNKVNEVVIRRCELFEKTVERAAQKKLQINKTSTKDAKGGKATKIVETGGPTATIIFSLAGGITIAVSVATYGAASFAAALVAGTTLLVKSVDKYLKQAKAKVVEDAIAMTDVTNEMSSYISCIVKEVAKELSRIFEFQLCQLQNNKQVENLAECAVELMLDLKKEDKFDRNTLLKKVLEDGNIEKTDILTKMEGLTWSAPNVFRKPGLRRQIIGKNGGEFKYFVKPKDACKTWKYGYRGQFLEVKKYVCKYEKPLHETPPMDETVPMDETNDAKPSGVSCKECLSSNGSWPTTSQYFSESAIDSQYTESQDESLTYHPVHILIQCPKILNSFQQLQRQKPSLARFLKTKFCLPEHHLVCPVYRPHSPGKVLDLQDSDLSGSDFSRSNFTGSCLEKCNFTKCVMLFTNLTRAKMSGSKFCDTYIHNSNLEKVEAYECKWTKTSLLYSHVDGAHMDAIGGNCLEGTDVSKMNNSNGFRSKRICDNNQARGAMCRPDLSETSDVQVSQYARTRPQPDRMYREPNAPSTSFSSERFHS